MKLLHFIQSSVPKAVAGDGSQVTGGFPLSQFCHIRNPRRKGYAYISMRPFSNDSLHAQMADGSWQMGKFLRHLFGFSSAPISHLRPRLRSPRPSLLGLRRSPISWAAASLLFLLPGIQAQTAAPAIRVTSETGPMIDSTRETIAKWVETKQLISKEKSEWVSGKDILGERVRLAEAETISVKEKLKEIELAVAEAQKKRDELSAENEKLKATGEKVKTRIIALEKKLRPLLKMYPDPLKEKLKPILSRFPEDSEKSTASLAERLQNVLGLVDQANAFNSTITSVKELRTFPDGSRAEVTTVYLGLAQAYYTNSEGTLAGVGHPGPDGWVWKPENAQGKKILMAVHMLEGKEKVATFIDLPVKIQ